jgi:hypothetical protein
MTGDELKWPRIMLIGEFYMASDYMLFIACYLSVYLKQNLLN